MYFFISQDQMVGSTRTNEMKRGAVMLPVKAKLQDLKQSPSASFVKLERSWMKSSGDELVTSKWNQLWRCSASSLGMPAFVRRERTSRSTKTLVSQCNNSRKHSLHQDLVPKSWKIWWQVAVWWSPTEVPTVMISSEGHNNPPPPCKDLYGLPTMPLAPCHKASPS